MSEIRAEDIAIVGMACRVPGAADTTALWRNLFTGLDPIRGYSDDELRAAGVDESTMDNAALVRHFGHLAGVAEFDAEFFGYSAEEAARVDPQHRLLLQTAWSAFEDAGLDPASCPDTGVFASVAPSWYEHYRLAGAWPGAGVAGTATDHVATRVSYALGLTGPSLAVQSSCSSSLVAVCLAAQSLADFRCDLALAGGAAVPYPARLSTQDGLVSLSGRCRAFDADADGSVFGSGVGAVVLKRLGEAIEDGDRVHAVIRGWAVNNDGGERSDYRSPSGTGQAAVVLEALRAAEVGADTVDYVETHGSGTLIGDALEVDALERAFRLAGGDGCLLGSVKAAIGHLDVASGVVGLIKSALVARHGTVPATPHHQRPNPHIGFATNGFSVNTSPVTLPARTTPRRTGVSSFGLGGTNAHVVLEQPPEDHRAPATSSHHLLTLSARTPQALAEAAARLRDHLEREPGQPLADIAFTLALGRRAWPWRRIEVVTDHAEAIAALSGPAVTTGQSPDRPRPLTLLREPLDEDEATRISTDLAASEPAFRAALAASEHSAPTARLQDSLARTLASWGIAPTAEPDDPIALVLGPGSDVSKAIPAVSTEQPRQALLTAVGRLWVQGVAPTWPRIFAPDRHRRASLPTYPFERARHWAEGVPALPD
ncbi:beta-ketoacyl synthase N-terminal-like domain-containing protein [Allokutzneria oryzae]|uniref:Beta-ketoacyl synthase N-terminal-like domain-containing protein n=1 Tax=Allokutzneria oryzae TaxID=1378989 RepID=A0ABV5ZZ07_9PSEU